VPRRKNKLEGAALGLLLVVGGIFWIISKAVDSLGQGGFVVVCIGGVAAIIWYRRAQYNRRIAYLRNKYGDEETVQRIMHRHFWQGQTAAQLTDSLGAPLGVDTKLLASRKREVWKYNSRGKNRYGLRITLDDDVVAGWNQLQ
jgi:hypothetical protein